MKFTEDQVMIIEDRVVNKIIYPSIVLKKAYKQGVLTKDHLKQSIDNLDDLIEWVRSLR